MRVFILTATVALLTTSASPAFAADLATFQDLINRAETNVVERLQRDLGIRDSQKQVESPEMSTNSTSLLDTTSVPDLFSFALAFSGLTPSSKSGSGSDADAASAAFTGYTLWSALEGFDPLDPDEYCKQGSIWGRRLSFTAGFNNGEDGSKDGYVAGVKFRVPLGYDLCTSPAFAGDGAVKAAMKALGVANGKLRAAIIERVRADALQRGVAAIPHDETMIETSKATGADFANFIDEDPVANRLAAELAEELGGDRAEKAWAMDRATAEEIDALLNGNQFAIGFSTKQRDDGGTDEYAATLIWDHKGLIPHLDFSVNAGWELKSNKGAKNNQGAMLAVGLDYQRADRTLRGRRPFKASLGFKAKWLNDTGDTYVGQLKLVVPIAEGFELPISLSAANRTELIEESEVRATFGFTVDTTALMARLQRAALRR